MTISILCVCTWYLGWLVRTHYEVVELLPRSGTNTSLDSIAYRYVLFLPRPSPLLHLTLCSWCPLSPPSSPPSAPNPKPIIEPRLLLPFWSSFHINQKGTGITGITGMTVIKGITGITEITVNDRNSCSFDRNYPQKGTWNLGLKEPGLQGNHINERNSFYINLPQKGMWNMGLKEPGM